MTAMFGTACVPVFRTCQLHARGARHRLLWRESWRGATSIVNEPLGFACVLTRQLPRSRRAAAPREPPRARRSTPRRSGADPYRRLWTSSSRSRHAYQSGTGARCSGEERSQWLVLVAREVHGVEFAGQFDRYLRRGGRDGSQCQPSGRSPDKEPARGSGGHDDPHGKDHLSALRPPYPYGGEFVSQFLFALRLCWFPLLVSTVAINYGAPGLQAANFLTIFGALDRLGGFFVLASVREIGPNVTAIVLAGVAGTAITADLGARKIREELDALQVLGVDPVKNLVVPALPRADDRHRPVRHLRGAVRHLRRHHRRDRQWPAARPILGNAVRQRVDHRPVGVGARRRRSSARSSRSSAATRA